MRLRKVSLLALVLSGCSGTAPDDESSALRDVLAGDEAASSEVPQLNRDLVRRAVRAGSYAELGAQAPVDEAWSPVVTAGAEGPTPLSVVPWIEAGVIDPSGAFDPCHTAGAEAPPLGEADHAALEARSPGSASSESVACVTRAALALAPGYTPNFVSAADHAIAVYPAERRVEINAALIELVGAPEPAPALPVPAAASPVSPVPELASNEIGGPGLVLRNHEPPTDYNDDLGSDDDCDCDDAFDCEGNDSNDNDSCSVTRSQPSSSSVRNVVNAPLWLLLAAALLVLRREARVGPSKARVRRFGSWLFFALSLLAVPDASAQSASASGRVEAGKRLLAKKDPAAALVELEAARREGAGPEVLAPLAQAYRGVGKLPEAYVALSELLMREEQANAPERGQTEKALRELEGSVAFVSVQVTPPGAALFVDGQPAAVDPRSRQLVVMPGAHTISANLPGHAPAQQAVNAERGTRNAVATLTLAPTGARVIVQGFAPDAIIALDGKPLTQGRWEGIVPEGRHLVQVYRPGGPSYDFPFEARSGQTVTLPPPLAAPVQQGPLPPLARPEKPPRRSVVGPYVVGHLGFAALTAKPFGFSYDTVIDDDTGQRRERAGAAWYVGADGGYRVSRGFGVGGLVLYIRGGGEGSVTQVERTGDGTFASHTGRADLLIQSVRLGPNFRFMAGGQTARFLANVNFGPVYHFIDLEHAAVIAGGSTLIEVGTYHHDYDGWGPFFGFDLGAEFTIADHMLLGFAFDVMVDRTSSIDGDPYEDTAQGYIGFSARVGYADWTSP
jgi:hypothetical protein